jgi:hypothetical protein
MFLFEINALLRLTNFERKRPLDRVFCDNIGLHRISNPSENNEVAVSLHRECQNYNIGGYGD